MDESSEGWQDGRREELMNRRKKEGRDKGTSGVTILFGQRLSGEFFAFLQIEVIPFLLRTFGKVVGHLGPNETSDETYRKIMFCSSGSDKTMQNVLALAA